MKSNTGIEGIVLRRRKTASGSVRLVATALKPDSTVKMRSLRPGGRPLLDVLEELHRWRTGKAFPPGAIDFVRLGKWINADAETRSAAKRLDDDLLLCAMICAETKAGAVGPMHR